MAMPFECQPLIRLRNSRSGDKASSEEFIKDESGDIEGIISDSVYLGLNTEYFIETGFASKIKLAKNQLLKKIYKKAIVFVYESNTQKLNVFSADGSQNLIKGVNHGT